MAERVFLHIGAPKTGTTFLQNVMWRNRSDLRADGLLFPGSTLLEHFFAMQAIRGAPVRHVPGAASAWERFVEEIASGPETALVSHEFLGMTDADHVAAALRQLQPAEVHVVFTARDYVRQFAGVWQETLKMNHGFSLDEFLIGILAGASSGPWSWATQDIPTILERWGKPLDPARVHVVTVPPSGAPRDLLWQRWCQVLGIDPGSYDLNVRTANESMGKQQAALLGHVNPHLSPPLLTRQECHRWIRRYLAHEVLVPQQGDKFGLRREHARELRRLSEEAAEAVDKAGYDVVGDLAELVPEAQTEDAPNPGDVPRAELVDVAGVTIERMVRDVRRLTKSRNEWRDRAKETAGEADDLRTEVETLRAQREERISVSSPSARAARRAQSLLRRVAGRVRRLR